MSDAETPTVRGLVPRTGIAVRACGIQISDPGVALIVSMFFEGMAGAGYDMPSKWLRTMAEEVLKWEDT